MIPIKTTFLKLMPLSDKRLIFSAEEQLSEVLVHAPEIDNTENEYGYIKNDDDNDADGDDDEHIHLQGKDCSKFG